MPVCQFPCTSYLVQPPSSEDETDSYDGKPKEMETIEEEADKNDEGEVRVLLLLLLLVSSIYFTL